MFEQREQSSRWEQRYQDAHAMLWSAFLDIRSKYDEERFDKRYRINQTTEIAAALLREYARHPGQPGDEAAGPRLQRAFLKLGLWTLAPRFADTGEYEGQLRRAFADLFGIESAADRSTGPDRPLLPSLPELGIEGPTVTTQAYRGSTHVRLESVVLRPLHSLRRITLPWNWWSCPFWTKLPEPCAFSRDGQPPKLTIAVRLPGGSQWSKDQKKEREVCLDVDLASSSFETRLDYQGREPEGAHRPEVGPFKGFLLVEKLAGRPGACRVVSEREGSFYDVNHDHFCKETLWYWLTSELVAFVASAPKMVTE